MKLKDILRNTIFKILSCDFIKNLAFTLSKFLSFRSEMSGKCAEKILLTLDDRPVGSCIPQNPNTVEKIYDLQIVVPAYNSEKYIDECLYSVINNMQNSCYKVLCTVINDGSTDSTLEKIISYSKRVILNRKGEKQIISIINQENKGFSGARNAALKNIKAKYITFLDSDDILSGGQ